MSARKTLPGWQKEIHKWARSKGWWTWDERETDEARRAPRLPLSVQDRMARAVVAEKLLLICTEAAEAAEELRMGAPFAEVNHETTLGGGVKPVGFPTELADIVIRVFDLAEACGIDMAREIARKMDYNERRAYRHGGKLI